MTTASAPEASTASSRRTEHGGYIPAIDGLRALAVLAVMVFHLRPAWLPGGFVGVDVFFVISGYVVTKSMISDARLNYAAFIAAFYARRFRRILPALIVCLSVTVLATTAVVPDSWLSDAVPATARRAFLGLSNFTLAATHGGYFAMQASQNPFTHTWSLAVEEQFYLVFPLVLWFALRPNRGFVSKSAIVLIVLLGTGSLAYAAWASTAAPAQAYYLLPARFWELAAGAGACLAGPQRWAAVVKRLGPTLLVCVAVAAVAASTILADPNAFPFPWALPAVFGTVVLVVVASAHSGLPALAAFASSVAVGIGLRSYSLYLWHWPVYTLLRWTVGLDDGPKIALALGLTFLLAELSFRFVERPARTFGAIRAWPNTLTIAVGLALIASGWIMTKAVQGHPAIFKKTATAAAPEMWYPQPDASRAPADAACSLASRERQPGGKEFIPVDCRAPAQFAGRRLFVIGDSHAGAYDRMFDLTARLTGIHIIRFSEAGCPWFAVNDATSPRTAKCAAFQQKVSRIVLAEVRPGDTIFVTSLLVKRLIDQDGERPSSIPEFAPREADAFARAVDARQATLILDLPKPVMPAPAFRCTDWFNRSNPVCAAGLSIGKSWMQQYRRPMVNQLRQVANAHANVVLWDPLPVLCPDPTTCRAFDGGKPLFFDGDHISGHANELLVPSFVEMLKLRDPSPHGPVSQRKGAASQQR